MSLIPETTDEISVDPSKFSRGHARAQVGCVLAVAALLMVASLRAVEPPAPYGPVPTERQLRWHELGFVGFLHFTVNTFTDREWGNGDEAETVFDPTDFDAEQIVSAAAAGGLKELILTCKHHDGFCLWPSKYTEHSVKNSHWKNGRGDVVKEISTACAKHGLKFGVYLSPWDRNHKDYGHPEYLTYYRNQLRELLTQYGPISEVWFDGANGGTGYYGGAREERKIDNHTYYDWPTTWKLVRELQPMACMFSDGGPDVRWVGNESGRAGDPCWATLNRDDFAPGSADEKRLNSGDRPGTHWVPAECDVSIRPGWFFHEKENDRVKTPAQLLELYYLSIGRGANFLLNLPPDRRGRIPDRDAASLLGFRALYEATFATNLAARASVEVSNFRGKAARFKPDNVRAGRTDRYWATDDSVTNAELTLTFSAPATLNVVRLREYLPLGQRVDTFRLETWDGAGWAEFAAGTSIGHCRLLRGKTVTSEKLRVQFKGPVSPAIEDVGVFYEPGR